MTYYSENHAPLDTLEQVAEHILDLMKGDLEMVEDGKIPVEELACSTEIWIDYLEEILNVKD
tara:strand:- start:807 stop:992 length:186 start_codon:yes stop_codon:yes gene_type:complete